MPRRPNKANPRAPNGRERDRPVAPNEANSGVGNFVAGVPVVKDRAKQTQLRIPVSPWSAFAKRSQPAERRMAERLQPDYERIDRAPVRAKRSRFCRLRQDLVDKYPGAPRTDLCQTNPIGGSGYRQTRPRRAKQSQSSVPRVAEACWARRAKRSQFLGSRPANVSWRTSLWCPARPCRPGRGPDGPA